MCIYIGHKQTHLFQTIGQRRASKIGNSDKGISGIVVQTHGCRFAQTEASQQLRNRYKKGKKIPNSIIAKDHKINPYSRKVTTYN